MNELLLRVYMKRFGDTRATLAKALGINEHTLYMKMREHRGENRNQQFTQAEIRAIVERYSLTPDQIMEIFFSDLANQKGADMS